MDVDLALAVAALGICHDDRVTFNRAGWLKGHLHGRFVIAKNASQRNYTCLGNLDFQAIIFMVKLCKEPRQVQLPTAFLMVIYRKCRYASGCYQKIHRSAANYSAFLMFAGKARCLPEIRATERCSTRVGSCLNCKHFRLGWKGLPGTNTLAYLTHS